MPNANEEKVVSVVADFVASMLAPAIMRAVGIAVDSRLGARPAKNGVNGTPRKMSKRGIAKNGKLSAPQERVLKEMVHFNKGHGGSIYNLPHRTIAHAQKRLANSLVRNGMIALENDENFSLTTKGRHYFKG